MDVSKITDILHQRNLTSLKEPRGFIKLLQIILAIFAFATTTNHSTYFTFQVNCPDASIKSMKGYVTYPYRLDHYAINSPICGSSSGTLTSETNTNLIKDTPSRTFLEGDYSSSAQFYVAIGVLAFLYASAALIIYVFFERFYSENDRFPNIDFIITMAFAILWFISTCAWAKNVNDLKYYSNPDHIIPRIPDCKVNPGTDPKCLTKYKGDFASLNVSIIFGFANLILWGGNIWFLYKETNWFKMRHAKNLPPGGISTGPSPPSGPTMGIGSGSQISRPPPPLFDR